MSRHEVNPIEDWESEELSEEELDLLAGGFDPSKFTIPPVAADSSLTKLPLLSGDVVVFAPGKVDSSYSSYLGTNGTSGNENSLHMKSSPMNLTSFFP